ncbi:DnaJ C-terminal domain-containing protein [Glycomyces harbinensis]|uniref:DnaJ C terminal domain-containing protein n=1 Tax=Glycomyces harbinensis TaxID=58114 RepID=A0A1G6TTC7_9ACTN|nr:DnaJ C-terminal domain-containing protein [Glycomyces harbinensis]SDD32422.1 DnaJ C terminal domain-containing protein [Glycomyces harbinensis]
MLHYDPRTGSIECRLALEDMAFGCEREVEYEAAGPCVNCEGRGVDEGDTCAYCGGSGTMLLPRTAIIELPPGLSEGDVLTVPCEGIEDGVTVVVGQDHHPVFKRDGLDLRTAVNVEEFLLQEGGAIDVETLGGEILVKIAAGLADRTVLRVAGQGMPAREDPGHRGDLLVTVIAEAAKPDLATGGRGVDRVVAGGFALVLVGLAIIVATVLVRAGADVCEPSEQVRCVRVTSTTTVEVSADEQEERLDLMAIAFGATGLVVTGVGVRVAYRGYQRIREDEAPVQASPQ